jgi:hypothetical protein
MLKFSEKLIYTVLASFSMAILFSIFYSYIYIRIPVPIEIMIITEIFTLGLPFYFILLESEDSVLGLLGGFVYIAIKEFLMAVLKQTPICFPTFIIFPIAFFIYSFGIAFSREQSWKEAKMSILAVFVLFLTFISSAFILIIYNNVFLRQIQCIELFRIFYFFSKTFR